MIRYRHKINPDITATAHYGVDCFQVIVTLSSGFSGRMHVTMFRKYFRVDLRKEV